MADHRYCPSRAAAATLAFALFTLAIGGALPPRTEADECVRYQDYLHLAGKIYPPIRAGGDPYGFLDLAVADGYAYLVQMYYGLQIVDVTDAAAPVLVGELRLSPYPRGVALLGDYAFLVNGPEYDTGPGVLQIVSVADRAHPALVASIATPGSAQAVAISGSLAFVANSVAGGTSGWLAIYDVSNPPAPALVGQIALPAGAWDVAVSRRQAILACHGYTAGDGTLQCVDVSDPAAPRLLGATPLASQPNRLAVGGDRVYVACTTTDYTGELTVADLGMPLPKSVASLAFSSPAEDVSADGNVAYVAVRQEGLKIVDAGGTGQPILMGAATTGTAWAKAVAVTGPRAFVAERGDYMLNWRAGLYLFDVARPASAPVASEILGSSFTDLAGTGNLLVAAGESYLNVYDVSDPSAPGHLGRLLQGGIGRHVAVAGTLVCGTFFDFGPGKWWRDWLQVFDISIPAAPRARGSVDLPPGGTGVVMRDSLAFIATGAAGLTVVNLADPDAPAIVGRLDPPGSGDGNDLALQGDLLCLADGPEGVQVIDVSVPTAPLLIGHVAGPARGVAMTGHLVCTQTQVIDLADPVAPVVVGTLPGVYVTLGVIACGRWVYGVGDALQVFDVNDPASPRLIGCGFPLPGLRFWTATFAGGAIAMCGDYSNALALMWPQCLAPVAVPGDGPAPEPASLDAVPNPFNPRTTIVFTLPSVSRVRLTVHDLRGREVAVLRNGVAPPGRHEVSWDGSTARGAAASGVYSIRLDTDGAVQTRKISLVR